MRFETGGEPRAGIYALPGGVAIDHPSAMRMVVDDPNLNEQQARPVVPYVEIYGVEQPAEFPCLPNVGLERQDLPRGTPFGIVGSASMCNRNTKAVQSFPPYPDGVDPFNTPLNFETNWVIQGAEAGFFTNADIHAVRILAMSGASHRSYGPLQDDPTRFRSVIGNERLLTQNGLSSFTATSNRFSSVHALGATTKPAQQPDFVWILPSKRMVLRKRLTASPTPLRQNVGIHPL
jgi:hypothetical protein